MKIAVVTDSASNIYNTDIDMKGLFKIPLQIGNDDQYYLEGEEKSSDFIYDLVAEGNVLKTSLPPLGRIESLFQKIKDEGYDMVFAVVITSGLSSTISSMATAAEMVGIKYDYFDTYATAEIQLHHAISARKMFDKGFSVEKVKERLLESREHSMTFVIPENLDHLAKSGRLTPIAAKLAGLLKIIPILYLNKETEGRIHALKQTRTMKRALTQMAELYHEEGVNKDYIVCIAHVRNREMAEYFKEQLNDQALQSDLFITELITTVGIHTGIGCVATQYVKKVNID